MLIMYYAVLHTGEVWFTQKIPIMVPTEGTCMHAYTMMYFMYKIFIAYSVYAVCEK